MKDMTLSTLRIMKVKLSFTMIMMKKWIILEDLMTPPLLKVTPRFWVEALMPFQDLKSSIKILLDSVVLILIIYQSL